MVDLAHLSPDKKPLVIRGDANYQFVYVNHQPIHIGRINQELADMISEMYNGSAMHAHILEMHTPLIELIKETDLDNVSIERIIPIIKNLITYDYGMFLDLMVIFAAMLESKDVEMKSNYIDFTIECSDRIVALETARTMEAEVNNEEVQSIEDTIAECEVGESIEENTEDMVIEEETVTDPVEE